MLFFCTSSFAAVVVLVLQVTAQKVEESLPFNFTLAALNLTIPNANLTGVPLVLGQNGVVAGAAFEVTSTFASYPYNDFPALSLQDTSLRAFMSDGRWMTNATSPSSGGTLGWLTTSFRPPTADKGFTAVAEPDQPFLQLAFRGLTAIWALCPFNGGQVNVVFNVSANIPPPPFLPFNPANCYAVQLNLVPI